MGHEPDESLELYRFKPNDKIMVMGQPKPGMKHEPNPGLDTLMNYEKKHLVPLNKTYEELDKDITELERNFLEGVFCGLLLNSENEKRKISYLYFFENFRFP
jgi:hypothetical protein